MTEENVDDLGRFVAMDILVRNFGRKHIECEILKQTWQHGAGIKHMKFQMIHMIHMFHKNEFYFFFSTCYV
jgi:hypothetical protein